MADVKEVAERNKFKVSEATYRGGPFVSHSCIAKSGSDDEKDQADSYASGFDSRGELMNSALYYFSRLEVLPQSVAGTSVMAVLDMRS